jgi:UDP-N-acetylglucosamine--N-acetylmuramyl-(pentapeptide) pyrophosphoryl-undecaprenol N-acetylglucosamine transferase
MIARRGSESPALRELAFVGGGTGGHLFPGIAIAERARELFPACRSIFYRTSRAVEERIFAGCGFETRTIEIHAPGKTLRGWYRFVRESLTARGLLESELEGADVVFGLGGYASVPGILAARRLGIPVILLEQNAVPGRVNRLFAPVVDAIACPHAGMRTTLARRPVILGNPVRRAVLEAAGARRRPARAARAAGERRTVLVAGGSQGAAGLNARIRDALGGLAELREKIQWIHIAGDADKECMSKAYRFHGFAAEVHAYSPDLPSLMASADLFLGRSGGTTVAELAILGLPSVLVPYPHHTDQHQRRNAAVLASAGAARILEEAEVNENSLRQVIREVLFDDERLQQMGEAARGAAFPDAADRALDLALLLQRQCPPASVSSS